MNEFLKFWGLGGNFYLLGGLFGNPRKNIFAMNVHIQSYRHSALAPHNTTPFFFYNWHIGIIKGIVDVHHLQSSIY